MAEEGNQLKADIAKPRDVGRGIVRIDEGIMAKLGLSASDVVEITGRRRTVAVAWSAYPDDENSDIRNPLSYRIGINQEALKRYRQSKTRG